jgi:ABC-type antimicrobial peptide transport system permease subunit
MLFNYFKIAVRRLVKEKGFSIINIFGLALGMACTLLILLWVRDERSVDKFHANSARLYWIYEKTFDEGKLGGGYGTRGDMAEEFKRRVPEVEMTTGFAWQETHTFSVGTKALKMDGNSAGADFFKMFSYPLVEGTAGEALKTPLSIAISRRMADAFFGGPAVAIGKTLRYENRLDLRVSAVFENLPAIASEKFEFLLNWNIFQDDKPWTKEFGNTGPRVAVLLRPGANADLVNKKIRRFFFDFFGSQNPQHYRELAIAPFSGAYLHSSFNEKGEPGGGRIEYVRLFSLIALFILLIAAINFMNLTTARSMKRSKEIGVRKVMGALRLALIRQFIGEAVLIAAVSAVLALVFVMLALPAFNGLTGKYIVLPWESSGFWLAIVALVIVTGVLSGSYPALYLSGFKPILVLKSGLFKGGSGSGWVRKGLVVFQFSLSIILIIATMLIAKQVTYVQNADLGYNRNSLFYIPLEGVLPDKLDMLIAEASKTPGIASVTPLSQEPTNIENLDGGIIWDGEDPNATPMFTKLGVGYDYVKTMGLRIVAGRDFSRQFATDSTNYILNETAAREMGFKDVIGRGFTFHRHRGKIIGVVQDFHFQSMHETIRPLVVRMAINDHDLWSLVVRAEPGKTREALAGLEKIVRGLNPSFPFTYKFSDEQYRRLYASEQVIGSLSAVFSVLAIAISCMGLLGLSLFTAEQRAKEIGIRKVLGASSVSLFSLLSREFLVLVVVAFLVAAPLAAWAMNKWLEQFAYRTPVSAWVFAVSGLLAVAVALATVCFQSVRAARANPIGALRSE